MIKCEIPLKFPSLNEYINECRANRYSGAKMKRTVEAQAAFYIQKLPVFENPIRVYFHWIEKDNRRDCDNIAFAKKFIFDTLVECGKIPNDGRKNVIGFSDDFSVGEDYSVVIYIEEIKKEKEEK